MWFKFLKKIHRHTWRDLIYSEPAHRVCEICGKMQFRVYFDWVDGTAKFVECPTCKGTKIAIVLGHLVYCKECDAYGKVLSVTRKEKK